MIETDSAGLATADVRIPAPAGELAAYQAAPEGSGPFPIVLVVHEIFGVNPYIRDVARRLAKLGYLALAPDLYARQGDVTRLTDPQEILSSVVARVPDAQVMADLDATLEHAARTGLGNPARAGLTGFCWGGRIAWLYAAHTSRLRCAVAWYGRLLGNREPLHPLFPIDLAARLRCPVLGLYGGRDPGIPLETVDQMRHALSASGQPSRIEVFPEAGHGFHSDYRPLYHPESATAAWQILESWFAQYLAS